MHEMSLAEGIVQIVETTAQANDASAVRAVWL
jgi:Zn finger protein HypA/HybF involved in hydrogenase expression